MKLTKEQLLESIKNLTKEKKYYIIYIETKKSAKSAFKKYILSTM